MNISAKDVKKLRDQTGVGMMDCKNALSETSGDFEAAVELLRKKGQKVAAKRADRDAKEGIIATASTEDGTTAVIVEVNCETDFVARNDDFQAFASKIANLVLSSRPENLDALMAVDFDGQSIGDAITQMTGKIGEKIDVRRFEIVSTSGQAISYIHPGSRLGVVVDIHGNGESASVGRDVAMQVAALNPIAATPDDVPQDLKDKEKEIAREAARLAGRPEKILDKIAEGKLLRYYKDNVLTEQLFVKDSSMKVGDLLSNAGLEVKRYVRFALGD